jgi:hypothetical protein
VLNKIEQKFDEIKINQGAIFSTINENKKSLNLRDYEFKIFSQWGEDGIIQHLIKSIEIKNKNFIEFGVEDFFESNCRFLLMNNDWKGFVIDANKSNILRLKNSYFYWKHHIVAIEKFITRENINEILEMSGFDQDLGILSIDLDGNDYFVLENINKFRPRILICEFNSVFGLTRKVSIPYDPKFLRNEAHYSNLYWGASLPALIYLANKKGYAFVGTNSAGCNAFFVRKDLLNEKIEVVTADKIYFQSNYRESRDKFGSLSYISSEKRIDEIKGMPVYEVEKQAYEFI